MVPSYMMTAEQPVRHRLLRPPETKLFGKSQIVCCMRAGCRLRSKMLAVGLPDKTSQVICCMHVCCRPRSVRLAVGLPDKAAWELTGQTLHACGLQARISQAWAVGLPSSLAQVHKSADISFEASSRSRSGSRVAL